MPSGKTLNQKSISKLTLALYLSALFLTPCTSWAQSYGQSFASPDGAVAALAEAAQAKSKEKLSEILGPASKDLINSGDDVAAAAALEEFNRAFAENHKLVADNENKRTLVVGRADWPFPIPLIKEKDNWYFDTAAGKEEIINRRIGRNELEVIDACRAYVDAQTEYAVRSAGEAEFAKRIVSSPGKRDGLYWPVQEGEELSPLGPLVAQAAAEGYKKKTSDADSFHGYHFRELDRQGVNARGGKKNYVIKGRQTGGYALIAYPARWGVSGIMTFVVNQDGVVYQKNLGPKTEGVVKGIKEFNPDRSWKAVEEE